jgi:hypothetical protein
MNLQAATRRIIGTSLKKHATSTNTVRGMAGKAIFNWKDPLNLSSQLTDEELMIQVRAEIPSVFL